jgi:hypothetical protein
MPYRARGPAHHDCHSRSAVKAVERGAFHYMGEAEVPFQRCRHHRKVTEPLQPLIDKHSPSTIEADWEDGDIHADLKIEVIVRTAAGCLVLL